MNAVATMNAGHIPKDVWIQDMLVGGGRIIGEACHYVDLLAYFTGSEVKSVCMNSMGENPDISTDNASILLKFANGSNGVINYLSNGHKSYSKERIEIYNGGRTLVLDNFRELKGYGFKGFSSQKSKQDKGHKAQFELFNNYLKTGGEPLISFNSLYNTTLTTFKALESLQEGCWKEIK
jgi:predicted dehydrogenase